MANWRDRLTGVGRAIIGGQGQGFGYQRGPDPTLGVTGPMGPPLPGRQPDVMGGAPIYAQEAGVTEGPQNIGERIWGWIKENPDAAIQAAGQLYGSYQEGQAQDRYADLQERRVDLEETELDRRAREREQERERRRQAYRNILRSRDEGG